MEVKEGMARPEVPQTSVADHNASTSGQTINTGITEEVTSPVTEAEKDARWIKELIEKCECVFKGIVVPRQSEQPGEKKDHKISKIRKSAPSEEEFFSQPRVVIIGPFHRDKIMTISDEEKCLIFYLMNHLYDLDLANYLTKKKNQVAEARQFYSDLDTSQSSDVSEDENKFAEMLLLDSYFILFMLTYMSEIRSRVTRDGLELFRLHDSSKRREIIMLVLDVVPRFANILHHKDEIMVDLLILKNQIPFCVIKELFKKLELKKPLHKYALEFFKRIHPRSTRGCKCQNSTTPPEFSHLLHLFHWSRVPKNKDNVLFKSWRPQLDDFYWKCYTPAAMKLKESTTVLFKKKTSAGNSLDITFCRCSLIPTVLVINIPRLHIHEYSSRIFHNLIAFEKKHPILHTISDRHTMAFSAIMHNLLQSEEDVKLLRRCRILVNTCMADYKIVNFFKSLSRTTEKVDMPIDMYVFCRQVQSYHNRRMNRMSRFYANAILKCFSFCTTCSQLPCLLFWCSHPPPYPKY